MPKRRHKFLVLLLALPLVLFFLMEAHFFLNYFSDRRSPNRFLIANNYQGWIIVKFGDPTCPALVHENDFIVLKVGAEPLCTSAPLAKGWADDVFAYESQPHENLIANPSSGLNRIWHEAVFSGQQATSNKTYFVFHVGKKLEKAVLHTEMAQIQQSLSSFNE